MKNKKERDWKFIIGMIVLLAIFAVMGGAFWNMVGKQAQMVREEEQKEEANAISAIYIETGEFLKTGVFVDLNNGTIFSADIPAEGIYNNKGKLISDDVLENGDEVKIYGDGIMLESYPGQYPGVTKIKVVKEGKASDADQYQDILDEFWPEKDPGELPYLNIGYCASYGEVSAAATRGGYSWSYADKDGVEQNKTADSAAVTQWPDLPVMNVDGTTDMELYFDTKPEKVIATAFPAELSGESDPGAGAEAEVEEKDGNYIVKDVQKDMIYLIRGEWGNGWVEFGFDVG